VRNDPGVIAAYLGTDERAIARSGAAAAPEAPPARDLTRRAARNGSAPDARMHDLTRADLLARAAELQVRGRTRLTKSELITAILESK
jgi:hypothetical protein